MIMKYLKIVCLFFLFQSMVAQVGINTTTPSAMLDITASDPANPNPNDGLLIPRIAAFPAINPGTDQDGMLVYLTTPVGVNTPGFYRWNHTALTWSKFGSQAGGTYYTASGTTDALAGGVYIPMPEMEINFTPKSDAVLVKFSAHGFPRSGGCNERPVLFRLVLNGVPITDWQTTTEVTSVGPLRPVWSSNITLPVPVTEGVPQTLSVFWRNYGCPNANDVTTPYVYAGGTLRASRHLVVVDPEGGDGISGTVPTASEFWSTSGNNDINPATHFIGTTTDSDLVFRRNNISAGRLSLTNVSFGINALLNNTDDGNTAIGINSAVQNTSGFANTAIGANALNNNVTGNRNVALGASAGGIIAGDNNVFLGHSAGLNTTTKSGSIFIGSYAGRFENNSNRLYVENSDANEDAALLYGEFDTDILRTNGTLQIGNPLNSGFAFPTTDGMANQIMQTDGSGNLNWTFLPQSFWFRTGNELDVTNIADDIRFSSDQTTIAFPQTNGTPASMFHMFSGGVGNSDRMIFSQSPTFLNWGLMYRDTNDSFRFLASGNDRVVINLGGGNPLVVQGTAQATSFQSATTTYPDYVFENYFEGVSKIKPDYQFLTLEEAIQFVIVHGHLPGVKPYAEVEKEGMQINLTETSITNLEKIEELFLYAVQLKNENEMLKSEQLKLEKRLEILEAYVLKK